MAADALKSNIDKLAALAKGGDIDREVMTTMLAITANRIFEQGKDAEGRPIGKYSKSYLKTRKKKGWGTDDKVILQLTQEMRSDFSVILEDDIMGLGFKVDENGKKSRYVEQTYKKVIFDHTKEELKQVEELYGKVIKRYLSGD